jgi:hypothetical protein
LGDELARVLTDIFRGGRSSTLANDVACGADSAMARLLVL